MNGIDCLLGVFFRKHVVIAMDSRLAFGSEAPNWQQFYGFSLIDHAPTFARVTVLT